MKPQFSMRCNYKADFAGITINRVPSSHHFHCSDITKQVSYELNYISESKQRLSAVRVRILTRERALNLYGNWKYRTSVPTLWKQLFLNYEMNYNSVVYGLHEGWAAGGMIPVGNSLFGTAPKPASTQPVFLLVLSSLPLTCPERKAEYWFAIVKVPRIPAA
jgi:hypothetical protein